MTFGRAHRAYRGGLLTPSRRSRHDGRVQQVMGSPARRVAWSSDPAGGVLGWARAHPRLIDQCLTAVLLGAGLAGMWLVPWSKAPRYRSPDAGAVLLTLAVVLPLLWRRQRPAAVLLVSGTAWFVYQAANYPFGVAWAATFLAVYSYACYRRRHVYWALAVWLAEVLATLGFGYQGTTQTVLIFLGVTAFVWVRGDAVRAGWLDAERQREERAQRAVADERARIARELHDIVAHALGIIVMQAGGAGSIGRLEDAQAKAVLATIERVGRQAFAEMRRLVGVLRDEEDAAALTPQPKISDIPTLVSTMAGTGLEVTVEVIGTPRAAPVGVELAAYRVVQEALTNSFKHAQAGPARVRLRWLRQALQVDVEDDGPGVHQKVPVSAPADSGGNGLVGMRERVSIYGGFFEAGPTGEGGFRVSARFPLEDPA